MTTRREVVTWVSAATATLGWKRAFADSGISKPISRKRTVEISASLGRRFATRIT